MDYSLIEVLTVEIKLGAPHSESVKVFDSQGQELLGVERLQLTFDGPSELYEISFVHNGQERTATLVNMETLCDNTTT